MKIVAVVGSKKGGKTTVVCGLVGQLKCSGFKVATVKFLERAKGIDVSDTETDRHRRAGADLAIASGTAETAVLKRVEQRENLAQLMSYIPADVDFVICEGVNDQELHRIVAVRELSEAEEYVNQRTIAISGVVASKAHAHKLPIVDVTRNPERLAGLVRSLA